MASRKDIKKDIKKMLDQVIQECYLNLYYAPGLHQENTLDVISDILVLREDLLKKVNHYPKNSTKKEIKLHFRAIIDELLKGSVEFVDRLI